MRRRRLIYEVVPIALLVIVTALSVVGWHVLATLRDVFYAEATSDLHSRATLIAAQLPEDVAEADRPALLERLRTLGENSSTRVTLMLPDGEVIAESQHDPAEMGNHSHRPEMIEALAGRTSSSTRYSSTLDTKMMYVAIPLTQAGRVAGVLRASRPVSTIDVAIEDLRRRVIIGGLIIGLGAIILVLLQTRRTARQLDGLSDAALRFARGDLDFRIAPPPTQEVAELADAMTEMARRLEHRLLALSRERDERDALLSSMVEGVVAVDSSDRVIMMNPAARKLLGVGSDEAPGRTLQETVRNPAIQQLASDALSTGDIVEASVTVLGGSERHLQAHGTPLVGAGGHEDAVMIVLNDVTRLRRLEEIRRDFAANVSHELRTPITSIKGFVETLRDGAIDNPPDAQRFLGIIEKQTSRLNAIIEDLLALSRLEGDSETQQMTAERIPLAPIIGSAVEDCRPRAATRTVALASECPDDIIVNVNRDLIERAIVNLIDNAAKYGHPEAEVAVTATRDDGRIAIQVSDQGPGIDARHLERIFERFYRVDAARSRQAGGTGLGLAIVKHIAQVHGGSVDVESLPGTGSTFTIYLPIVM